MGLQCQALAVLGRGHAWSWVCMCDYVSMSSLFSWMLLGRETSIILRFAGKSGNPFQTKQGNRHSCCNQEGRRGSNDVVRGTWVLPSSEACMLGNFGKTGLIQRFAGNVGNPLQTKHGSRPSCCDQGG